MLLPILNCSSSKRKYFQEFFKKCTSNIKKSWRGIKTLMGRNTSSKTHKVNPIKINNEICSDHQKIANEFNKYFCSVAHELDNQIPCIQHDEPNFPIFRNPHSLFVSNVTSTECSAIIGNLKNTYHDIEKISTILLKNVRHVLSPLLTYLFNCSFLLEEIPIN